MLQLYNTFAQEMAKLLLDWLKNQIFLSQEMQYFYTTVTSAIQTGAGPPNGETRWELKNATSIPCSDSSEVLPQSWKKV